MLFENSAKPDIRIILGKTALQCASEHSHEAVVRLLLTEGEDINADGLYGTALKRTSEYGREATIRLLLAEGADINACGPKGTGLHFALRNRYVAIVRLLLDHNADPSMLDQEGKTAADATNEILLAWRYDRRVRDGNFEIIEWPQNHTKAAS